MTRRRFFRLYRLGAKLARLKWRERVLIDVLGRENRDSARRDVAVCVRCWGPLSGLAQDHARDVWRGRCPDHGDVEIVASILERAVDGRCLELLGHVPRVAELMRRVELGEF